MAQTVRAKFKVYGVTPLGASERVTAGPVSAGHVQEEYVDAFGAKRTRWVALENENSRFWRATPNGMLDLYIDNPDTQGFFQPNKEYYLDFTLAEEAA